MRRTAWAIHLEGLKTELSGSLASGGHFASPLRNALQHTGFSAAGWTKNFAHFGFDLQNTMLAEPNLGMAGYSGDRVPPMQKRMIQALQTIPGVEAVGLADAMPFGMGLGDPIVFRDNTTHLRPTSADADAYLPHVAPGYFRAAGTTLLSGRDFSWQDDKNAPRLAGVVCAMALPGLVARWIPAQRVLSIDPLVLLRED